MVSVLTYRVPLIYDKVSQQTLRRQSQRESLQDEPGVAIVGWVQQAIRNRFTNCDVYRQNIKASFILQLQSLVKASLCAAQIVLSLNVCHLHGFNQRQIRGKKTSLERWNISNSNLVGLSKILPQAKSDPN